MKSPTPRNRGRRLELTPRAGAAGGLGEGEAMVPTVYLEDPPRIRIYDPKDDGSFWFRGIGFTSKISEP